MEKIIKTGRLFYALAMIVYGVQQFIYADFRAVFVPAWQTLLPGLSIWAYLFGIGLIVAGLALILEKKARTAALLVGGILLLLFCVVQIPFEIFADPYSKHLGVWTNALKELALAGGAFVMAGSFPEEKSMAATKSPLLSLLEKFIPLGPVFFSITMLLFGIDHLLYTETISHLVPDWIPGPIFWTYVAGFALIGAGAAIILNQRRKEIGILLAIMIFIWVIVLHIPRAIAAPFVERGNELSSVFDALAFTGTALVIAFCFSSKKVKWM